MELDGGARGLMAVGWGGFVWFVDGYGVEMDRGSWPGGDLR